jgi:hypothetical protein
MRRLVAAGLLPERAGQPVKAWVHISLADLLLLDGSSALQEEWTAGVRARWAAHRAAASAGGGGDGGAWLDGEAAVVIHRWGWTLVLNPDGTTTAWNKVLHSHSPPARAG